MTERKASQQAPWRVLVSTRWLFGHLLALSLVTLFIIAGFWQLNRLQAVRADNEVAYEQAALSPLPIDGSSADAALLSVAAGAAELELRPAVASGVFEPESELLLRSRSWNGQPGWHVLTPLRLEDDTLLLVNRGWVPYDHDTVPVKAAPPPEGPVTVTGIMRASQVPPTGAGAAFAPRDPAEGPLAAAWYVDLERFAAGQLPGLLPGAWLLLQEQSPAQAGELPVLAQPAAIDEGPHLGYAIQWFSFAAVGIIGYTLLMRKLLRDTARSQA